MIEENGDITELQNIDSLKDNPSALGLCAFGMTTLLLNLLNIGFTELSSIILGLGIFIGAVVQLFIAFFSLKKSNLFSTVFFSSYGIFWLTLIFLIVLPMMHILEYPSKLAMGFYYLFWAVYTLILFNSFKLSKSLKYVFITLVPMFFLLAFGDFTGNSLYTYIAGVEGIVCGLLAIYIAFAQVLNELFEDEIFPL